MRGLVFVAAVICAAPPFASAAVKRARPKPPPPAASLTALNTHEEFALRPDASGHFGKKQLHGWSRFLRCHHTGRVHAIAPRLASLLYETAKHYEFKQVFVVAGYRAPRIARKKGNPRSPHKQGLACDFRVEGVSNTELRDFLRATFARVGVGYYPNSDFVHLDVRQKASAFWIDYSGPGERARYSRNPEGDLEGEREEPTAVAGGGEPTPPGEPAPNAPAAAQAGAPSLVAPAAAAAAPALGGEQPQKNSSPWPAAPNPPPTAHPSP